MFCLTLPYTGHERVPLCSHALVYVRYVRFDRARNYQHLILSWALLIQCMRSVWSIHLPPALVTSDHVFAWMQLGSVNMAKV